LAIAVAILAVYLLRLDSAAGLIVDDAWYVVLARALAQGNGYRLISSAVTEIMPAVPPGYPLILAPLFILNPAFPGNVMLLKSVSITAMMGVGYVVYVYLINHRGTDKPIAAAIAFATVLTPAFVFLATSTLMAECVFTLGQVLTVLWLERVADAADQSTKARRAIAAGVLAAATMLVRTMGAAAVLAGVAYLLKERAYRPAVAFVFSALLCLAPWTIYSVTHAPTAAQVTEHGGTVAYAYSDAFRMTRPGEAALGAVHAGEFAARIGRNLVNVFSRDLGGVLVPSFFRGADESGEEIVSLGGATGFIGSSMGGNPMTMTITFALSAVAGLGFIGALRRRITAAEIVVVLSLAAILIVPARTFRYIVPLTPYLLFYFVSGVAMIARTPNVAPVRIALLSILALQVLDHSQYIVIKMRSAVPPDWLGDSRSVNELADWMNTHLEGAGAVASTNPGLVYLLTGRKTVATDDFTRGWPRWKASGIRYVVALRPIGLPLKSLGYRVVYESKTRQYWVIEIEGP
jgi:hypothetical protein